MFLNNLIVSIISPTYTNSTFEDKKTKSFQTRIFAKFFRFKSLFITDDFPTLDLPEKTMHGSSPRIKPDGDAADFIGIAEFKKHNKHNAYYKEPVKPVQS